jgi:SAM-dependent methyltransferase
MSVKSQITSFLVGHSFTRWLLKWDTWAFAMNRILGRPYADYYAARMKRYANKDAFGGCGDPTERKWQFDFCIARDLIKPADQMLDYGCGAGAAGHHFIRYLQPDAYVGADITPEYIDIARKHAANLADLASKQPAYLIVPSGDMSPLLKLGRRFNFIWAQSVIGHMPPDNVHYVLGNIAKLLRPGGRFYCTAFISAGSPRHTHHLNFWLPKATFDEYAAASGLVCEIVSGWTHPYTDEDNLLCFRPASSA